MRGVSEPFAAYLFKKGNKYVLLTVPFLLMIGCTLVSVYFQDKFLLEIALLLAIVQPIATSIVVFSALMLTWEWTRMKWRGLTTSIVMAS